MDPSIVPLLRTVQTGAVVALKGSWLVKLKETGGRLPWCHDLPADAYWDASELSSRASALGDDANLLFVAVSSASSDAADLPLIASVAKLYLGLSGYYTKGGEQKSPLAMAHAIAGYDDASTDFALFWPCVSLEYRIDGQHYPQSAESALWFRHAVCWLHRPPSRSSSTSAEAAVAIATEAALSALSNAGLRRLELSKRTSDSMRKAYGGAEWEAADRLDRVCASWLPPRSPERFAAWVESLALAATPAVVQAGKGEPAAVAAEEAEEAAEEEEEEEAEEPADPAAEASALYAPVFLDAAASTRSLDYSRLGWGTADVEELSLALPYYTRSLTHLSLAQNSLDEAAASALCSSLVSMAKQGGGAALAFLDLSSCDLGAEGAAIVSSVIASGPSSLTSLDLSGNFITNEGARSLAEAMSSNGSSSISLHTLSLATNEIRTEGAEAIGTACAYHSSLTELSLRDNLMKDEGAIALAAALSHRRPWGRRHRLRALDVRSNGIGQMGAQALTKLGLGEGLQVGVVINLARTPSGRFQVPGM